MKFVIIFSILLPVAISLLFSKLKQSTVKSEKKMSDDNFTVEIPNMCFVVGMLNVIAFLLVLIGFTVFSKETPHIICYIALGLFIWLGAYLMCKTLTFKVMVKNEEITLCTFFRKPYAFTFSDIKSVHRQIKQRTQAERLVIKTTSGRRFVVEHMEISYERFVKKILLHVDKNCLTGF